MKRAVSVFACAVLIVAHASAAAPKVFKPAVSSAPSVSAPALGYAVLTSPLELRLILGTPDGSGLDDPVALPPDISAIALAPGQRYALVLSGDQGQIQVLALTTSGPGAVSAVTGAVPQPDLIVFSPSGSSAVLVSSALQRLQALTGLPDAPSVSLDVDVSQFGSAVTSAAVSDDASMVLVGLATGSGGSLARVATDGTLQTILNAGNISAIRFIGPGHDAAAADGQLNRITLLNAGSDGQFATRVLATDAQGVNAPRDLEFSTDHARVYVANAGANNILMVDAATGNSQAVTCGFPIAAFQRLMTSAIAISGQNSRSVWVTDTDATAPWVAFVPSLR